MPPPASPATAVPDDSSTSAAPAPERPAVAQTPAAELRVALLRTTRRLKQQRGAAGLSDGQHAVLVEVCRRGPSTPGALAEHERISAPSMTRILNGLVELGLVRKDADPQDGRQVLVDLTDAGRDELAATRRARDAWLADQLDRLDAADRETLRRAAEILVEVAAR
ncbi:MarR family winged helix-turn-helix transcriptional regulator [Luteimicrobium subarcticum]|nr:MarR family transcriptional regulator [Luteimicrobium subarcticum]